MFRKQTWLMILVIISTPVLAQLTLKSLGVPRHQKDSGPFGAS